MDGRFIRLKNPERSRLKNRSKKQMQSPSSRLSLTHSNSLLHYFPFFSHLSFLYIQIVSHIQGSIEVVPKQLNKGVIVQRFLNRLIQKRAGRLPVFALIIGDELSDDVMFEVSFHLWQCVSVSVCVSVSYSVCVCV